jgi:hypothetical protein
MQLLGTGFDKTVLKLSDVSRSASPETLLGKI